MIENIKSIYFSYSRGRNLGCSLSLSVRNIVVALVLKVYPWMLNSFGLSHLFSFHALILVMGIVFVICLVPETRGLTLTELATLFGGEIGGGNGNGQTGNGETTSESTMLTSDHEDKDLENAQKVV